MDMSTGTLVFVIALAVILVFGAVMIWRTFRNTARRRGSEADEEMIEHDVYEDRPPSDFDGTADESRPDTRDVR